MFRIKSLNVKFSKYQKQSPEDVLLKRCFQDKTFTLENIRDAVFNLTKFHTKCLQLYSKEIPVYALY